jgi:hypothetical protein
MMVMEADPENWINEELGTIFLQAAQGLHTPDGEVYGDVRHEIWSGVIDEMVTVEMLEAAFPTDEILNDHYLGAANTFDRAEVEAEVAEWKASM